MENKLTSIQEADLLWLQQQITFTKEVKNTPVGGLSDGYHTFDELYEFRKVYNAALFNEWGKTVLLLGHEVDPSNDREIPVYMPKYDVHKSWKHYDGEPCFGGMWFIVSAMLPTGLISNHYHADDWDLFQIPELEKARYEFDGHTSQDVLQRLKDLK